MTRDYYADPFSPEAIEATRVALARQLLFNRVATLVVLAALAVVSYGAL